MRGRATACAGIIVASTILLAGCNVLFPQGDLFIGGGSAMPTFATIPLSAAAASLPACRASDLELDYGTDGYAMGTHGVDFSITNGGDICALPAAPAISLVDATGKVLIATPAGPGGRVELDTIAFGTIGWSSWCGAPPVQPLTVRLTLTAGDSAALSLPAGFSATCMNGPSELVLNDLVGSPP